MHKTVFYNARNRFTKKKQFFINRFIFVLLAGIGLAGFFQIVTVSGASSPSSVSIEQCANGPAAGTFNICKLLSGSSGYVTGAVNAAKAHWREGDFLPYRAIVVAPNSGTQQVAFSFDTAKNSELRHAIDYLSSYDLTETTAAANSAHANQADPCSDKIASCNPSVPDASSAIPVPTSLTTAYSTICASGAFAGSPTTGSVKAWVSTGTISISSVTIGNPDTVATNCPSKLTINFTLSAPGATVVFAWSGHVAANTNPGSGGYWGTGNAIPTGSPYHMDAGFDQVSGGQSFTVGSQDLALAATAVAQIPTVNTELHNNSGGAVIPLNSSVQGGTSAYDVVTVGGTTNGTPTGTADFRFYSSTAACTADTAFTGGTTQGTGVALVSGVAQSTATGSLGAGTYAFKALYHSTDISKWIDGVQSACEPFTVNQGSSGITTTLKNAANTTVTEGSSVALGTVMHDLATVTLTPSAVPTGSVTFRFYSTTSACTADTTFSGGTTKGTIALDGNNPGVASPSTDTGALSPGTYAFKANWPGNANYTGNTSGCETFTVNQGTSSVATTLHKADHSVVTVGNSVPLGSVMHDLATVTVTPALAAPSGNVDFRFYTSLASCSEDTTFTGGTTKGSVALDGATPGVAHPSTDSGSLAAGTYAFKAKWAGDGNYSGNTSSCENFNVDKAQLGIGTTVHSDAPDQALSGNLALGSGAHDSATVTGKIGAITLPNVTFYFFPQGVSCTNGSVTGATQLNTLSPDGSNVAHPSTSQTGLAAGTYNFMAVVAGNDDYLGATSNCEPFTVDKAQLSLESQVHDASHVDQTNKSVALGSVMHDTAKLNGGVVGGFTPSAITFKFYLNGTCDGDGTTSSNVGADEGDGSRDRSAVSPALSTGPYAFKAFVAGDSNYLGSDSGCEPFSVSKAQLGISTTVHSDNPDQALNGNLALGSGAHDSATVTGKIGAITLPDVTFYFFAKGVACTNGSTTGATQLNTLAPDGSNVAHPSTSQTNLAAGTYNFMAVVAGDTNYDGATSDCEPFTVNKADLGVDTELHKANEDVVSVGASVDLGTTMHDKATVSGINANFTPANKVSFAFYSTNDCSGDGADAGSVALVNGVAHPSNSQGPLGAGSYGFTATIAGDDNYNGQTSSCEHFNVNKADLGLTTTIHTDTPDQALVGNAALGASLHDSAAVSGINASFTPTNNVTFKFYDNNDCSGDGVSAGSHAIVTATAHPSSSEGPLSAGAHAFRAFYASDSNYNSATSDCEPFTVNKAPLGVNTTVHSDAPDQALAGNLSLGSGAHDSASVTGKVGAFTLPDVTFYFFDKGVACTNGSIVGATALNTLTPDGSGVAHPSTSETNLAAGTYNFMAVVAGNTNYDGVTGNCEPFTVDKAQLTADTKVHDANHVDKTNSSVALNSVMHDTAKVSGSVGNFSAPAVTFTFYVNGTCDGSGTSVANTGADEGDAAAVRSAASAALGGGSYAYKASVAGNDNYLGDSSDCEPFTVSKADLGITTTIHNAAHDPVTVVALGSVVHDTASVTGQVGAITPTGAVTFEFFTSNNCTTGVSAATNTGADGSDVRSADSSALAAGSYSYHAMVAGDTNYNGQTSSCEPLTVNKAQLGVATIVHDITHTDKTNGTVPLGSAMHDTATVSGGVNGFALPAVSFTLTGSYTDSCASGASVANNGAEGSATKSADSSALGAGNYAYRGSVATNDNYLGANSTCEPFTVNKATPTAVTEIHNAAEAVVTSVPAGTTVHDKDTVTGQSGFDPTGNVDFTFYTSNNCTTGGSASGTGVVLVAGVAHPSTSQGPLAVGSYSFKARYNGDGNYTTKDADCEPLTVTRLTPGLHTTPNPSSGTVGTTLNDSAQLTSGFNPTGSITFKLYSPSDPTCANTPAFTNAVTVAGNGTYNTSAGFASNAAGTWRWVAVYSGDANNISVTSGCNDEQVTITSPTTRTLGFWQTHFTYTTNIFGQNIDPTIWTICPAGRTINNTATLFGGFYASIPKKSDNKTKRSDLDQARMQLMQQLLAAILNHLAFGSGSTAMLDSAKTAYCGTDRNAILSAASTLDAFNNSGDSQPTSQNTGSADPKASQAAANIATWDLLP